MLKNQKELYQIIVNLPYQEFIDKFEDQYDNLLQNSSINEHQKVYLKEYYETKYKWCKAYMKETNFTCGICSTQRGINSGLKGLNMNSSLQEMFDALKNYKLKAGNHILEEKAAYMGIKESRNLEKVNLMIFDYIVDDIPDAEEKFGTFWL